MKKKTTLSLLLAALMLLSTLTGCGSSGNTDTTAATSAVQAETTAPTSAAQAETTASSGLTITDMKDRTMTFDEPVERIVVLTASDCEILYAVGAGSMVVGRGTYCDYPAEVESVPVLSSGFDTNVEEIIALDPQTVLMSTMSQPLEHIEALEAAGIRCVVTDARNIAEVYTAIELIGSLAGKDENAAAVITEMKTTFEELQEKAASDGSKTVYFEVSPLEYGLWTAGSGTFMDELATMLGLTNAFSDVSDWGEVSEEQVIERNPDYIVTIAMHFGEGPTPEEEILSRTGWQGMTAIQNNAILNADSNEISRPGPRLANAAKTLYDFLYEAE